MGVRGITFGNNEEEDEEEVEEEEDATAAEAAKDAKLKRERIRGIFIFSFFLSRGGENK